MLILLMILIFFILLLVSQSTNNKLSYSNTLMLFIGTIAFFSFIKNQVISTISVTSVSVPLLLLILFYFRKNIRLEFHILKEFLITSIISLGLLYFINHSFYGLDLNEFETLNSHFNSFINTYYFNSSSTNLIDYFFIEILHLLPDALKSIQLIQTYSNVALFTFYFIFITFIFDCIKATQNITHNCIYIVIFGLYFVSLPALAYNYLNSLWLIIPITYLYQSTDNIQSNRLKIGISLLFGLVINPILLLIAIIIVLCINKKTSTITKLILTFIVIGIAIIFNPTSNLSLVDILLSNKNNTLLPLFYINRKQIVISLVFFGILLINIFNLKNVSVKTSNLISILLLFSFFVLKNTTLLYILMLTVINPFNFVQQIHQFVELTLEPFVNVNNVPIALALLSIWMVSYSVNFNPFEISNKSTQSIFLDNESYEIIDFLSKNYSYESSINSQLISIEAFMPNINTSDNANILITKDKEKEVAKNYSLVFNTDNYFIYENSNK